MDYFKLQVIRASILRDVDEFVPKDHYSIDTLYGIPQGKADYDIGRMFFSSNLAMTARQASALNVLMTVGLYAMTDGELMACRAVRLKQTHENPELEVDYNRLLSDLKYFELDLCAKVKQYAQHLPDNEAKAILFLIMDDIAQTPTLAAAEKIEAVKDMTTQTQEETVGYDDAESQEDETVQIRTGIYGERDLDAAAWVVRSGADVEKMTVTEIKMALKTRNPKLWSHGFNDWNRGQKVWPKKKPGKKSGN